MAQYSRATLTDAGVQIARRMMDDDTITMTFTGIASGDGNYSTGEDIAARTALKNQIQFFPLSSKKVTSDNVLHLKYIISNVNPDDTPLTVGYYVREIGIYAQVDSEPAVLYAIAIADSATADYLPEYDSLQPSTITMDWFLTVGNAENVSIAASPSAYALASDLAATNAVVVTKLTASGGDAANAKIGSSTASTASYPVPAANDTFKVILGKIIKFFSDIKQLNSVTTDGLVPAPTSAKPYRFYSTGGGGNPGWNTGPAFTGASSSENGITGLVPGPASANYANRNLMYLRSSGEWAFLPLQNNATTTAQYYALDARMGKTLQDQITRLNRNDHYDLTLASGASALGSQTLWIIGSVAILHLCFRATSALAANAQIATLPTGNQYSFPGNYATNKWGSTEARTINISSAGVVTLGPRAMATNEHVEFLVVGRAVAN